MRVAYIEPSQADFALLFESGANNVKPRYRGGGIDDIRTFKSPIYYQRGSGLFSIIANLARRSIPFLRSIFLPAAADFGRDVAHDYAQGSSLKSSAARRLAERMGSRMRGGGKRVRRRRVTQRKNAKTKQIKNKKVARKRRSKRVLKNDEYHTAFSPDTFLKST